MAGFTWLKYSAAFSGFLFAAFISETVDAAQLGNGQVGTMAKDSLGTFVMSASVSDVPINQNVTVQTQSTVRWYTMITKLPRDWNNFGNELFDTHTIPVVAGLGVTTIAFMIFDHKTYAQTRSFFSNSSFLQHTRDDIVNAGDGKYHLIAIGGFAAIGLATSDNRLLRTSSEMVEAFLASGMVVQILKHTTGRESPSAAMPDYDGDWRLFPNQKQYQLHQPRYYSFPSGHLATMVGSLTVLNENYPEYRVWLRPASYLLTGMLGVSLVGKGMHWYSDLPLGIALGYSFGEIVSYRNGINVSRSLGENFPQINLSPSFTMYGGGVGLNVEW